MAIYRIFDAETKKFYEKTDKGELLPENGGRNEHFVYAARLIKGDDYVWYLKFGMTKTFVSSVRNSIMRTSYDLIDAANGKYDFTLNISATPLTVFDPNRNNNPVYKGNYSNLTTCEEASDKCDEVIIVRSTTTINNIFIYKSNQ